MQKMLFERVFADYEIVEAPPRTALVVEKLLLPANPCSKTEINSAAISSLAWRLRRIAKPWSGRERFKVCVSRVDGRKKGGTQGREYVNGDAFEARLREMGYRVVEISKINSENRLALWANATDIVGIHGAGMMNMIFMPPDRNYAPLLGALSGNTITRWDTIYSRDKDVRHAQCGAHILRCPQAEMEHEGERWAEDLHDLLLLRKLADDDARAGGAKVPKSTLNWITREYQRILKKALRHCDKLPDFELARKRKRGRKKRRPGHNLALRLQDKMERALLFLHDLSVPSRTTMRPALFE